MFNTKYKKFYISILVLAAVAIGLILTAQLQRNYRSVHDAIPAGSTLFFESDQTGHAWKKLTSGKGFWPSLLQIEHFRRINMQMALLDSTLKHKPGFFEKIAALPMALVVHPTDENYGFTLLVEVQNNLRFHEVQQLLLKQFGTDVALVERNHEQHKIGLIVDNRTGMQFNFSITRGLFIGSFDRNLMELSLDQLSAEEKIIHDASYKRVRATKGQRVDGHLFVHTGRLAGILESASADLYKPFVGTYFKQFAGWAALDVMLKPDEVLLNGYTDPSVAEDSYLSALKGQQPVNTRLLNILPFSTRLLLHFGMSDYALFNSQTVDQQQLQDLSGKYGFDLQKGIIDQINEEIALVFIDNSAAEGAVLAARIKDQQAVQRNLRQLGQRTRGNQATIRSQNVQIEHLNISGLAPALFGTAFNPVENFWYTLIDNYLLIGNNAQALELVVRLYRSGRTLDLNENFKRFANNLAYQSNILFYTNLREGLEVVQPFVNTSLSVQLERNHDVWRNFEGLAIQFSHMADLVYTNVFIKHNPDYKEEGLIAWKTPLDAPVSGKPSLIEDHVTGKYLIIVFDQNNQMYLISPEGEILWKRRLNEEPMSEVYAVDYYKNGRIQYLFNTPNYLYLVDRNGNDVANYPIRLRAQATNGLSLFDYSNNRDYRILLSGADKTTYNYNIRGLEVDGWEKPRSQEIVTKPVERLLAGGRDYIIITDIKGNIRIVDRRGRTRISPRGQINKALHSDFYVNRTNSRGILLTTNKEGNLLYVASNGNLATTDFGSFSPRHFFLYEDFNNDGHVDFIYLDGNDLTIFDRFQKELFGYQFKHTIVTRPVFFKLTRTNRLLGIVSELDKEIYLIDKAGRMIVSSGLVGETPFAVGSLHNDNQINLVTGAGNSLYNYVIY